MEKDRPRIRYYINNVDKSPKKVKIINKLKGTVEEEQ
jgi:hypothetical protein